MDENRTRARFALLDREVTFRSRPRALLAAVAAAAVVPVLGVPGVAQAATGSAAGSGKLRVKAGQTLTLSQTTRVSELVIEPGGALAAPSGYSLSVTVNGVETGSKLTALTDGYGGVDAPIAPGAYRGDVVITVAVANPIAYLGLTFPFRQALYVTADGAVTDESVLDDVVGGQLTKSYARNVRLRSTGEAFNGVYVTGGDFLLQRPEIEFTGNGRCDFVGYGASVYATGADTTLVVDGADIHNKGVVRTTVIADGTSNVVVKNSRLRAEDGELPAGYVPTSDQRYMIVVPWMLGISGNVRATNLLGAQTKASYLNSHISSENWGALSVDAGSECTLTAINSHVENTGEDGYGSYAIGQVTEHFLGVEFDVASYATINWGGTVHYGDSTRTAVAALNDSLGIGLSTAELAALTPRPTVITSRRFGVMWQSAGAVTIDGGTQLTSAETTFLLKAAPASITIDGSGGARLRSGTGVLFQLMDNDNPGKTTVTGKPWSTETTAVYTEPTGDPAKDTAFDVTTAHSADATFSATDLPLRGDFYNSVRGDTSSLAGMNAVLIFTDSRIEGVISATVAKHRVSTIDSSLYRELGEVTNTVHEVVNNGMLVTLAGASRWTVTGTSYLSSLTLSTDATVTGKGGRGVKMTVNGTTTPITVGRTYTGAITISLA
ncbi:MAG TPA: hypothetical protein VG756_32295 [Pseudonocardiaceae bacterium]|nr:hypothetical protein [Pseudonocardiaceae bacterium]